MSESIDPRLRDVRDTAVAAGAYAHAHTHTQPQRAASSLPIPIAAHPSRSPVSAPPPPPPQQQYPAAFQASPHPSSASSYLPQTPHSAANAGSDHDHDHDHEHDHDGATGEDPKRPRACEACRGLKVRCEPDPNNPSGDCRRCAKAHRTCIVTVPSRKRQKKTDSRIAELEKKIGALTETLAATNAQQRKDDSPPAPRQNPYQQVTHAGYKAPLAETSEARLDTANWSGYPIALDVDAQRSTAPPMVMAGQKRKHADSRDYSASSMAAASSVLSGFGETPAMRKTHTHEYSDVVDRGLVTSEMANAMFQCYVERMTPHLPAVIFPEGTRATEVRKTKPTLFLAILAASSGMNYPEIQRTLTKEIMSIYAERVMINGEKTLELIQALHVSTLWYWPPENFEELKFYQLIHVAAVMAIDIGMGKRTKSSRSRNAGLFRDHPWRQTPYPDPEGAEARRAWLVSYFLCCNAAMGLRRTNLIRWTPFMDDCLEYFDTSPNAVPSDKLLCAWIRLQHIAEEIGSQFSMDDPTASVKVADSKVQYALKGFERDLEKWNSQIPEQARNPLVRLSHHVVNLYMHEVAMHVDHNVDEFKPPFREEALRGGAGDSDGLTAVHISALSSCLTSIDGIFESFLQFDAETIQCLPIFNFVRVAYAVVVLIKMYFAAATPNSELGKVIDKDNMKVEHYLDNLVESFRAAAADEKSRPAAKFLMVLIMLKTWFHRQRENKGVLSAPVGSTSNFLIESSGETATDASSQQERNGNQNGQSYSPSNTPLQLLSEVATGNSRRQSESVGQFSSTLNDWQQQPAVQGFDMNHYPTQTGYVPMPGNLDPNDFDSAFGMTLGVGDLGYDEAFFGNFMGGVGNGSGFEGF